MTRRSTNLVTSWIGMREFVSIDDNSSPQPDTTIQIAYAGAKVPIAHCMICGEIHAWIIPVYSKKIGGTLLAEVTEGSPHNQYCGGKTECAND